MFKFHWFELPFLELCFFEQNNFSTNNVLTFPVFWLFKKNFSFFFVKMSEKFFSSEITTNWVGGSLWHKLELTFWHTPSPYLSASHHLPSFSSFSLILTPWVNFTSILGAAFTLVDTESVRKIDNLAVFFTLLGSSQVKAVFRTFMKLSPDTNSTKKTDGLAMLLECERVKASHKMLVESTPWCSTLRKMKFNDFKKI